MARRSGSSRSERRKIGTDYLSEPGYPIIYVRIDWMQRAKRVGKYAKNRRKRSKIDKWRFKNNYSRKRKVY